MYCQLILSLLLTAMLDIACLLPEIDIALANLWVRMKNWPLPRTLKGV